MLSSWATSRCQTIWNWFQVGGACQPRYAAESGGLFHRRVADGSPHQQRHPVCHSTFVASHSTVEGKTVDTDLELLHRLAAALAVGSRQGMEQRKRCRKDGTCAFGEPLQWPSRDPEPAAAEYDSCLRDSDLGIPTSGRFSTFRVILGLHPEATPYLQEGPGDGGAAAGVIRTDALAAAVDAALSGSEHGPHRQKVAG